MCLIVTSAAGASRDLEGEPGTSAGQAASACPAHYFFDTRFLYCRYVQGGLKKIKRLRNTPQTTADFPLEYA
jgi:hypothetical protein